MELDSIVYRARSWQIFSSSESADLLRRLTGEQLINNNPTASPSSFGLWTPQARTTPPVPFDPLEPLWLGFLALAGVGIPTAMPEVALLRANSDEGQAEKTNHKIGSVNHPRISPASYGDLPSGTSRLGGLFSR